VNRIHAIPRLPMELKKFQVKTLELLLVLQFLSEDGDNATVVKFGYSILFNMTFYWFLCSTFILCRRSASVLERNKNCHWCFCPDCISSSTHIVLCSPCALLPSCLSINLHLVSRRSPGEKSGSMRISTRL
jgi:hypothetical protein